MQTTCIIYWLSSDKGEPELLRRVAADRGWTVTVPLQDDPLKAPKQRTGYKAVLRSLTKGGLGALIVPSLLALGSTLDEAVALIVKLRAAGVHLVVDDEIDTRTPEGAGWLAAVASLAGYQQEIRKQKARAGQRRAQNAGLKFGRPPIDERALRKVRAALASGGGIRPTARRIGLSPARVQAEKAAMLSRLE